MIPRREHKYGGRGKGFSRKIPTQEYALIFAALQLAFLDSLQNSQGSESNPLARLSRLFQSKRPELLHSSYKVFVRSCIQVGMNLVEQPSSVRLTFTSQNF